jgi:hypothetical protein
MNVTTAVGLGLLHRRVTVAATSRIVQVYAVVLLSWMSAQYAVVRELLMGNATVRAT